jgi:hypothetical protein
MNTRIPSSSWKTCGAAVETMQGSGQGPGHAAVETVKKGARENPQFTFSSFPLALRHEQM